MEIYILYGVKAPDLDAACALVEQILNIKMEPRGNWSIGDYFGFRDQRGRLLRLQENIDIVDLELDGADYDDLTLKELLRRGAELKEENFPHYRYLLYVESAEKVPEFEAALDAANAHFERLRTRTWHGPGDLRTTIHAPER